MGKTAFMYAGQGAQTVGMGKELCGQYSAADHVFDEASISLGLDVKKLIWESDAETLKLTENAQPSIVTMSAAVSAVLAENGCKCDTALGLSLGEYNALVAAGAVSFRDCVAVVKKRGRFMQEAVPVGIGAMSAVIGLSDGDVLNALNDAHGLVYVANYNCPGQIVISGHTEDVRHFGELLKERGAKRVIPLDVSAPFHSPLMKPAAEKLADVLKSVDVSDLDFPVVANVTADYVNDKSLVKDLLIKQVYSPVKFGGSISRLIDDGFDTFVEIGPGNALSGFVKKISKEVKVYSNLEVLAC